MKAITLKQWEKMPTRSRDWLVVKSLGFFVKYFWHISLDGTLEMTIGGSYETKDFAERVMRHPPNCISPDAMVVRSVCYWCVSTVPNCAQSVIDEMVKRGWRCDLTYVPGAKKCARFFRYFPDRSRFYEAETMEEAICGAALQALNLMEQYPF